MPQEDLTLFEYFRMGSPLMWVILCLSIISIGLGIYRFVYLIGVENASKSLISELRSLIKENKVLAAMDLCNKNLHLIAAQVFKVAIEKQEKSKEEIRISVEEVANKEIPKLESWLPLIGTITALAPLLGLLGTIIGMVQSFREMQINEASGLAEIAGGIWTALLTTVAGLTVAIISLVLYNYLSRKVSKFVTTLEYSAAEIVYMLHGEQLVSRPDSSVADEDFLEFR